MNVTNICGHVVIEAVKRLIDVEASSWRITVQNALEHGAKPETLDKQITAHNALVVLRQKIDEPQSDQFWEGAKGFPEANERIAIQEGKLVEFD